MNPGNTRLLERLFADGLITAEAQEAALNLVARTGERVEECILELKALDEAALLKYLAALHKTRFVSTEKLAKADIDRITLDKVPKKLAERDTVFPVLYDAQTGTLSVVTPDPDNAPARDCSAAERRDYGRDSIRCAGARTNDRHRHGGNRADV